METALSPSIAHPTGPLHVMHMASGSPLESQWLRARVGATHRRLRAGQYLYYNGERASDLYMVRAGFLKLCASAEDGSERVTGFRMRSDMLGVGSIGVGRHTCDAVALDTTDVWVLPFAACGRVAELQTALTAALAEEIRRDRAWMMAVGSLPAEQRVAHFLIDLAERHDRLGFNARRFTLCMGRADIASFLALTHETISRALSHLAKVGCIAVSRRDVQLLDIERLRATGTSTRVH